MKYDKLSNPIHALQAWMMGEQLKQMEKCHAVAKQYGLSV